MRFTIWGGGRHGQPSVYSAIDGKEQVETTFQCVCQTVFSGSDRALVEYGEKTGGSFQVAAGIEQAVSRQVIGAQFA